MILNRLKRYIPKYNKMLWRNKCHFYWAEIESFWMSKMKKFNQLWEISIWANFIYNWFRIWMSWNQRLQEKYIKRWSQKMNKRSILRSWIWPILLWMVLSILEHQKILYFKYKRINLGSIESKTKECYLQSLL